MIGHAAMIALRSSSRRPMGGSVAAVLLVLCLGASAAIAQLNEVITILGATDAVLSYRWAACGVHEAFPGKDLNGDGDTDDTRRFSEL